MCWGGGYGYDVKKKVIWSIVGKVGEVEGCGEDV